MLVGKFQSILDININTFLFLPPNFLILLLPRISVTHFFVVGGAFGRPWRVWGRVNTCRPICAYILALALY